MKLKFAVLAIATGLILGVATPTTAQAQRKVITTHSTANRGAGTDQNVKSNDVTNRRDVNTPVPPRKGGPKTRGARVGTLHVDNRTPWYIRIYVDGDYRGTIAPYGDWYADGSCDEYALYAVAAFDDGSSRDWGPVHTNASCGDQVWRLEQ